MDCPKCEWPAGGKLSDVVSMRMYIVEDALHDSRHVGEALRPRRHAFRELGGRTGRTAPRDLCPSRRIRCHRRRRRGVQVRLSRRNGLWAFPGNVYRRDIGRLSHQVPGK